MYALCKTSGVFALLFSLVDVKYMTAFQKNRQRSNRV